MDEELKKYASAFARTGGLGRAKKRFAGKTKKEISEIMKLVRRGKTELT